MAWLADGFVHPERVDLPSGGEPDQALDRLVPQWPAGVWGFRSVHYFSP
jgi:hypothetical protein